ncbi:MAG: hypothetical protein PHT51_03655 [Patescibacteria group bacterium]|nr:hypothetical protein [Patescibacteria group bacterium]MDD4610944.1 hypothetical protein [Patescibacteria group bacterium]
MNKKEELKFATFFINWVNKRYGYDYRAVPNNNENKSDNEIDIYAISNSAEFQTLNLQLTTSEGKIFKESALLLNKIKKTGASSAVGRGLNGVEWINAIERKEREYSKDVKNSLILLIQQDIGPLFDESFQNYKESDFKGIYLVHLPSSFHDGQVLVIKNVCLTKNSSSAL